jgi:SM-20-related protein
MPTAGRPADRPRRTGPASLARLTEALADPGWIVVPGFVPPALVAGLAARAWQRHAAGAFRAAAVGTGAGRQVRTDIRGDQIHWLDADACAAEQAVLRRFEGLRLALNRELQLGLFEYECHYALYPAGAVYARHVDQFAGCGRRIVSAVLYLNEQWTEACGGHLRLYLDGGGHADVLPAGGTLALFQSERFAHEVLPARRERLSLTGWFQRRA